MFIKQLEDIWSGIDYPFLQESDGNKLFFKVISSVEICDVEKIKNGDVWCFVIVEYFSSCVLTDP